VLEPRAEQPSGAATVMVVDDSVSVCRAIERMLAPRGHRVVALNSGEEALAVLAVERPDLVVCDVVLPDVEGLAICRFVRESPALAGAAVLLISGLVTDEVRREAIAAGADSLLAKPFRGDALLAQVDALLARAPGAAAPGPRPAVAVRDPRPAPAVLAELEKLAGLRAGSWRLADGRRGRFPAAASAAEVPDPELILARLRSFAAPLGVGAPATLLIEGEGGEMLLVGHRDRRGCICLRLTPDATFGKARYLVRTFLTTLGETAAAGRPAAGASNHPLR
jgi:DNA-binding response OmpR family regulator